MRNKLSKWISLKTQKYLLLIFLFGLILRFLYFPDDISFGYDQARDAYVSLYAVSGDLKILGPAASVPGIYHGALIYYILGPLYKIFSGSPFAVAAVFRIINAIGIILIFFFLKILFQSEKTALLGALFYALSFEQTQYAMFLGHPALGIITVLTFFIGLSLLVFPKKIKGLYVACLGLGLTIQFHFSSVSLFADLIFIYLFFRKSLPRINLKQIIISTLIILITMSTYIVAEFKYGFRTINTLTEMYLLGSSGDGLKLQNIIDIPKRVVEANLINSTQLSLLILIAITTLALYFSRKEQKTGRVVFLLILFSIAIIPYIFYTSVQPSYYYSLGASIALMAIAAYVINKLLTGSKLLGYLLLVIVIVSNIGLIAKHNPKGTVPEINAQEGMLLTDAIKVMDFAYSKAEGEPFAVSAITIPYNINTTWSYLFEWYGGKKYGYLPVWGGENALGFENVLTVEPAQSKLPSIKITIIEPPRGLTGVQIETFLEGEDIFWQKVDEARYGEFTVQQRIPKKNLTEYN